jgi:hypothetical protein
MVLYWETQVGTARAVLATEEGEHMEKSANQAIGAINSALAHPITFLGWVFAHSAFHLRDQL